MLTNLAEIELYDPCRPGWKKLLRYLGKSGADEEPLGLLTVLDSNGIDDALWVLDRVEPGGRLARHFSAWCAEQVLHVFEHARPGDPTARRAIGLARDDSATPGERVAARAAAWAAAQNIAWDGVGNSDAWNAAWAAVWAVVGDARNAARAAVWADASGDAQLAQSAQLRKMLTEGF